MGMKNVFETTRFVVMMASVYLKNIIGKNILYI